MLKKIAASLLASLGLLSVHANSALAEPTANYVYHRTLYPSSCNIAIEEEVFGCNSAVIGGFRNGSANIKLCNRRECLILILTRGQLRNAADGEYFYVREIALQRGNYITRRWYASLTCAMNTRAMRCIGDLENGTAIAINIS